jgi:hypothetical protein
MFLGAIWHATRRRGSLKCQPRDPVSPGYVIRNGGLNGAAHLSAIWSSGSHLKRTCEASYLPRLLTSSKESMTARFHLIGAMTLALVLGGCASREELATSALAQTGGGTSPDAGSNPGTAATGNATLESVSQGLLPSIAPQTLRSTTGVTQNQQVLDRPQDQPSSIQSDPGSPGPGDGPDGDTGSGQLSYPTAMERQFSRTP